VLQIKNIFRPETLGEALQIFSENPNIKPLMGGTDLVVQLRESGVSADVLDLTRIESIKTIKLDKENIYIGAGVSHAEIANSQTVADYAPLLAQSSAMVGSPAIRNRGTIGGNVGNASPVAESIPTLIAHNAIVNLQDSEKTRQIKVEDFHLAPGKTAIQPGELITGFTIPRIGEEFFGFYKRLGSRASVSIAKVGVALSSKREGNRLLNVRIALSAVAPRVLRAKKSEKILSCQEINSDIIGKAAEVLVTECSPISDLRSTMEYRADMVRELFKIGMAELFS